MTNTGVQIKQEQHEREHQYDHQPEQEACLEITETGRPREALAAATASWNVLSNPRVLWAVVKEAYHEWKEDEGPRLGAALAYYAVFSLAPVLIIAIAVAGLVFGEKAAQGAIAGQLQGLIGPDGARAIESIVQNSRKPATGALALVIGVSMIIIGASGAFGELQTALNAIWKVKHKSRSELVGIFRDRFLSLGMVLGVGFLLLVSLVLSAAIQAVARMIPSPAFLLESVNFLLSFIVITALFAMIFKLLPDTRIPWSDVWIGAAFTSLFFTVGKILIGLYIGRSGVASPYGAAASIIIVLLWIYYSAQILFFGAEFTRAYAKTHGSRWQTRFASGRA